MKKTTPKTKSPAPATRSTKTKKKTVAAEAPVVSTPAAKAVPASIPEGGPVAIPAIPKPVRAVSAAAVQTKIVAKVDVGYGNTLYVRGEGPGLTWSAGVPMECVAGDQWEITLGESARPISFKVLINDQTWCSGADSVVASGSTATITPEFI